MPYFKPEVIYRIGYASIGAVYLVTGLLSLAVVTEMGGMIADHEGTLQMIEAQPFGTYWLLAVGLGLVGYVAWRVVETLSKQSHAHSKLGKIGLRMYSGASGIIYSLLAWASLRGFVEGHVVHDRHSERKMSAQLISMEGGEGLLVLAGMGLIGGAVYQIYKGLSGEFLKEFDPKKLSVVTERIAVTMGRMGLPARGLAFGIMGGFAIASGLQSKASHAKGTQEVLLTLIKQPYGNVLLGCMAIGFIAYAIHCFLSSWLKHFRL